MCDNIAPLNEIAWREVFKGFRWEANVPGTSYRMIIVCIYRRNMPNYSYYLIEVIGDKEINHGSGTTRSLAQAVKSVEWLLESRIKGTDIPNQIPSMVNQPMVIQ